MIRLIKGDSFKANKMFGIKKYEKIFILYLLCYFVCSYIMAYYFYNKGFFSLYDIFFDADPCANLNSIAHGWGRHAISHPILEILSLPIRTIELIFYKLNFISDRIRFRELLALGYAPFFTVLTYFYLRKILIEMKISLMDCISLVVLFSLFFTNILFSILPETYAISCFSITLCIYYFLQSKNNYLWFFSGILLTGFTITNVIVFVIVYFLHLYLNKNKTGIISFVQSILYSLSCLIICLLIYKLLLILYHTVPGGEGRIKWIRSYTSISFMNIIINPLKLIIATFNAVIAPLPTLLSSEFFIKSTSDYKRLSYTFKISFFNYIPYFILVFPLAKYISFAKSYYLENRWFRVYLASFLILSFNIMLHIFFGREFFMYTKHWIMPLFFLFIPFLLKNGNCIELISVILFVINITWLINIINFLT